MKLFKYIFLITISSLLSIEMYAYENQSYVVELKKEIVKEFNIKNNGTINVTNKYGNITVHDWNKQSVKFEIIITVKSSSEKKAANKLNEINVVFLNEDDYVSAITEIEERSTNWFWSWWGSSSNVEYEINYNVWCPATLQHELNQSYGNINTGIISGLSKIEIAYGDLKSREFNNSLFLELKYGDARVSKMKDGSVDISYGEFECFQAGKIKLDSKYSKIVLNRAGSLIIDSKYDGYNIGQCEDLQNDGKYDDFEISKVKNINIVSGYTNIHIDYLDGNADIQNKYATIIIDHIGDSVNNINVDSKYSTLFIPKEKAIKFVADGKYIACDLANGVVTTESTEDLVAGYNLDKNAYTQVNFLGKYGKLIIN